MKYFKRLVVLMSFLVLIGGLACFSVLVYFSFTLPKISSLADYNPPIKSKILSKDGVILYNIGKQNRELVEFDDIPPRVVDAFLSAEDSNFYEHEGVDYVGVLRAFVANIKAGRVVQGGSTITQQVAKSLLLTSERSITRKIKDFLLAQKIEKRFNKKEILYLYLNQVYLGGGYYGIKSAFEGYFNKELSEATVAESALIAGLLVAPGKYSPYRNPQHAKTRQAYVLGRMFANKKITKEEYQEALQEKIKYQLRKNSPFLAGYFTDWVRRQAIDIVGEENFLTNGFTVQTTLNYELQKTAEESILEGAKEIDKRQGYKGPVGHIDLEKLDEYIEKFRKDLYKDKSNYFTLTEDNEREYEIQMQEDELEVLKEFTQEQMSKLYSSRFYTGYNSEDQLLKYLEKDKLYKAVVLRLDSRMRNIIISVGGITGVIPYHHYRWAHERAITDNVKYWGYVKNPNTILKKGDVIQVRITDFSTKLENTIYKTYRDDFRRMKDYKHLKDQNYLMCALEQEPEVQAALMSLNPFTGEVVSMSGGVDFDKSEFNRALQSKRQPGSAFKPLLFAAALENGYLPNTIILDTPEALGGANQELNWKPRNYDGKFKGPMTLREALEHSRNIPTIKLALDLGMDKIFNFLDRIDFHADMPNDLSISLGSFGVTLLEMIRAYSIFPNGGKKVLPKSIISITDRNGKEYFFQDDFATQSKLELEKLARESKDENRPENVREKNENGKEHNEFEKEAVNPYLLNLNEEQVYDPRLAYIMTNLLKGVVHYGTGRRALSTSQFIGGKTGTTSSYVDAWFLGFSQNIVTGVWTGMDDNRSMGWPETGTKASLPIWNEYMKRSIQIYGERDFQMPPGIVNVSIDKKTGELATGSGPKFLESFVEGTEPGSNSKNNYFKKEENSQESGAILEDDDFFNN
ncbi:PBP1A family penicillin-binding protein [Halobacteriovorax vibrionivorans]|uniref:Penicillin-binding protein 1A n=1 Tax=Halobacteriovorax vibrionivorans TaxID=2152716 RepID=A0ABY0IJ23_9BACT|nr:MULTISPECIES: PBP1A family penicillin-binding protein [Halobacteriovorax]RZF22963.1 PBP1A family penicillin-binding protein [Halobacteriovorax vibrionivorans]TGD46894.1 PBP1A family penicillin-binding protein [Halobacteriovorax sp. Y22]